MLVLTRKPNESLQIGEEVTLTIIEVRGDKVRIGITAPRSVQVKRLELLTNASPVAGQGENPCSP